MGGLIGEPVKYLQPIGDLFIRLVKMIIVPVVCFSLINGVANLPDLTKLRSVGTKTAIYFLSTTVIALIIGLILANFIQPGANFTLDLPEANMEMSKIPSFVDQLLDVVPTNPLEAMIESNMLQIIFFSIFFGACLLILGETARHLVKIVDIAAETMYKMTGYVMRLIPYAVFALMANVTGKYGYEALIPAGKYSITMYLSVFLHIAVTYTLILKFTAKVNPIAFYKKAFQAWIVGFSICSSSATLPVTMKVAIGELGVPQETASFILPLGATTNMDGSGIYFATVTVFMAQICGIPLPLNQHGGIYAQNSAKTAT